MPKFTANNILYMLEEVWLNWEQIRKMQDLVIDWRRVNKREKEFEEKIIKEKIIAPILTTSNIFSKTLEEERKIIWEDNYEASAFYRHSLDLFGKEKNIPEFQKKGRLFEIIECFENKEEYVPKKWKKPETEWGKILDQKPIKQKIPFRLSQFKEPRYPEKYDLNLTVEGNDNFFMILDEERYDRMGFRIYKSEVFSSERWLREDVQVMNNYILDWGAMYVYENFSERAMELWNDYAGIRKYGYQADKEKYLELLDLYPSDEDYDFIEPTY